MEILKALDRGPDGIYVKELDFRKKKTHVDALLYDAMGLIVEIYNDDPSLSYSMAIGRIRDAIKMLESKDGRR